MAVCVAASALAWRCAVAGPAITPIDLPTAIRLALDQPAARAAAHEVAASQALVEQADRLPNPELTYLREGQQAGTRTTTVQINQPIELGRKRRARVAVAQQAAGLAQVEWQARRQDIRADVVMAWHEAHIAARRREVAQALTDLARRTVDVAGRRVAAGKISPIDETRARLAAVDAATALTQAEAALTLARTRLGALVGQPADALVLAADSAPLPDVEPLAVLLARAGGSSAIRRAQGQLRRTPNAPRACPT
jgi:cobalt-zinc-cadmium efflux system outer membrane protein